jgi:23S rRNA (cytidine2498-2'-O)-methyltransferase
LHAPERNSGPCRIRLRGRRALSRALPFDSLIFARQKLLRIADLRCIDPKDRITPILAALEGTQKTMFGDLWVEHPDSDACKPPRRPRPQLRQRPAAGTAQGRLARAPGRCQQTALHVIFLDGDHIVLAYADARDGRAVATGHPAPAHARDAPSRSALKLEEALLTLLSEDERRRLLRDGMRGADLGAAPGGWTWVLVRNGLHVTAI